MPKAHVVPANLATLRSAAVRAIARLPSPVRRSIWRARRWVDLRQRRRREARGDFSRSYPALSDLDRQLEALFDRDGGFFVEAGGNDGIFQSNTYALERKRRWRGILVEPEPELARACALARPGSTTVRAALVAADFREPEVTLRFGGSMTLVVGARADDEAWVASAHARGQEAPAHEFTAPARTLSSILDEAGAPEVDLLSLDIEGYEAQALAGLDFDRHAPRFILVEMRDPTTDGDPIEAVLGDRYQRFRALSDFDILYARADEARRFDAPASTAV
jgi:FkbM family methyltransferase